MYNIHNAQMWPIFLLFPLPPPSVLCYKQDMKRKLIQGLACSR